MVNFSICLIAKNEAGTLPRLFDSLKPFKERGGEVVLIDTGSTDDTAKIARNYGCVVEEVGDRFIKVVDEYQAAKINHKFVGDDEQLVVKTGDRIFDFSSARNYSASLASNDMISNQDCDEAYTVLDIDRIQGLIKQGYEQFEYNFVFSHDQFGGEAIKFVQCKFYDRRKLKWVGIIHEVLQGSANRTLLDESIIKLEHWQNPQTDRSPYLRGLALDCFLNPQNDRNSHYFAREMLWAGRYRSALKEFERHIAMNKWHSERAQSYIYMARCYGYLGQPDKQVECLHKAFQVDSSRREPLIELARFYQHNNNPQVAKVYALAALGIPWNGFYANDRAHYTNEPHEILYWADGWTGDIAGAREQILKALEYQPRNPNYLRDTKYYFEYADPQIQGWTTYPELTWLYETAKNMTSIAEVGSWKGRSTHALLSGCKGVVHAIDHFYGSKNEEGAHWEAKGDAVYNQFLENTKQFTNLKVNRKDSLEAANDYPDKHFDMTFIDAEHTYEGVSNDIKNWLPKTRILVCGHDYDQKIWPGVKQAVDDTIGYVKVHQTIWYKLLINPKVSIVIPTLDRPEGLQRCIREIHNNANYDNYEIIIESDSFTDRQGVPKVLKRGVEKSTGELVMFLANDIIPQPNFLFNAVIAMAIHYPDLDGLIGLNDMYWKGQFATHWLASKKLLPYLDGEFFHTGYHHTGCDNELTERCKLINRYHWAENAKVYHDHPVQKGALIVKDNDRVYQIAYSPENLVHDRELLYSRAEKLGFKIDPNLWKTQ